MIPIKTEKEINIMQEGGRRLAEIIEKLKAMTLPGITTNELNRAAEALVFKYKAEPAFKGYAGKKGEKPFPAALCVSVNSVLVHAAPSAYKLKQGDIVSLDLGIKYKGFYTDMAVTQIVGEPLSTDNEARRLIRNTKKALKLAIKKAAAGNTIGDISSAVQEHIEGQGFNVIRELCGHGIGRELHEEPQILNYGKRHSGPKLKPGMVICIEPMASIGDWRLKKSPDGYGYETEDGSLSCHFEHTILITKKEPEVLTEIE